VSSLWSAVAQSGALQTGQFLGRLQSVALAALHTGSSLANHLEALRGRSVLIATCEPLASALAMLELDGVARRMVICTPDLSTAQLAAVSVTAAAEAIVIDDAAAIDIPPGLGVCRMSERPEGGEALRRASEKTEWVLLTSGTTGVPKLVSHSLESLSGTLPRQTAADPRSIWSTFYDIRRYGGLQIYLRALLSGSPLVLTCAAEPIPEFMARAAAAGVTHISGTPSHWRRALMTGHCAQLTPAYVRLSGEVADQALLDSLRATFPQARIVHAFASTEAGVAFEVHDGLAGFPAAFVGGGAAGIDLAVVEGTLRIRSARNAARYLGGVARLMAGEDGFVDTGDLVERVAERYYFRGRVGGVINVGGLKVFPEEVESVINADSRVRVSLVRARRNPITGAVVVADVVLNDAAPADPAVLDALRVELLRACRSVLPEHKVPAMLRFVPTLEFSAAGKLVRPNA
jgi:acyl-coenzyme A synthetase/AMP-(fatty) acid ligase